MLVGNASGRFCSSARGSRLRSRMVTTPPHISSFLRHSTNLCTARTPPTFPCGDLTPAACQGGIAARQAELNLNSSSDLLRSRLLMCIRVPRRQGIDLHVAIQDSTVLPLLITCDGTEHVVLEDHGALYVGDANSTHPAYGCIS